MATEQTEEQNKIHAEAVERFKKIEDRKQRKLAIEDIRFAHVEGAQWDDDAVSKRRNRPRYSINRVAGAIAQIVGDQRQNRTQIKTRPISSGADEDKALILDGLIRNIESISKAENAYDSAFDEAVTGGFGGWRVLTEFNDDDTFDQDIRIIPINSAASSLYFDSMAQEYDKRDAMYAFVVTNMPKHDFEDKWPDHSSTASFTQERQTFRSCKDWFEGDFIRVAEYWKKIPVEKTIALLSDGRTIDKEEEESVLDELAEQGITILKERQLTTHKVVMYVMNGNEIIEERKEWAGKFIPLVPVFGKITHAEGRVFIKGMTRDAKDPQRIYNYTTSQIVETSALTPKDPYWYTPEMKAGHESAWQSFNTKNDPFMPFNIDPKMPGPPQRTGAPSVQQALLTQIQQAALDIESTTGVHAASLGNAPQLLSEKSIQTQAEKGDRGAFIFVDNLQKSIQYTGEILIDLIPKIYDTQRAVRVLNVDGTSKSIEINQVVQTITDDETGEENTVNDLTVGKYDVITDTSPATLTKREETARQLIELTANDPQLRSLSLDIITQNLDINEGKEMTKRVRKLMIQQGLVEPTEEEAEELGLNEPQPPDPAQVALLENIRLSNEKIIVDIERQEAEIIKVTSSVDSQQASTIKTRLEAQKTPAETLDVLVQTMLDKIERGVLVTQQEINIVIKQRDIVAETQQALDPGPNSVQSADIVNPLQRTVQ